MLYTFSCVLYSMLCSIMSYTNRIISIIEGYQASSILFLVKQFTGYKLLMHIYAKACSFCQLLQGRNTCTTYLMNDLYQSNQLCCGKKIQRGTLKINDSIEYIT